MLGQEDEFDLRAIRFCRLQEALLTWGVTRAVVTSENLEVEEGTHTAHGSNLGYKSARFRTWKQWWQVWASEGEPQYRADQTKSKVPRQTWTAMDFTRYTAESEALRAEHNWARVQEKWRRIAWKAEDPPTADVGGLLEIQVAQEGFQAGWRGNSHQIDEIWASIECKSALLAKWFVWKCQLQGLHQRWGQEPLASWKEAYNEQASHWKSAQEPLW